MTQKVVNIGKGILVPAYNAVKTVQALVAYFQSKYTVRNDVHKKKTNRGNEDSSDVEETFVSGTIRMSKKKSDQFSKGLSELLKGVYPGPLINSLLLSTSKKSTFSMDYHKCRQETILGKFPYWIDESIIKTMISYVLHCFWILSFLQTSCVKYSSLSRGKKSNSLIWHTSRRGTDRSLVRTGMNRSWSTWPSNLASQSGKPFRGSRSFVRMRTTTMNLTLKVC